MCELFQASVAAKPDAVALRASDGTMAITWQQYGDRVRRISAGLAALGVRRGDTVGLMLTNRPEFHLVDAAVMHLGAIPFSIYNTSTPDQIAYLFANAANRIVVCEEQFAPVLRDAARHSGVERIVCIEDGVDETTSLNELEHAGAAGFDFEAAWRAVQREDIVTLIYTSGTTGPPKGVEITHANILFTTATSLRVPANLNGGVRGGHVISYLPDAHLANRWMAHYVPITMGSTVTTVANPKMIGAALRDVRPTMMVGVPMLWYKLKAAVEQGVEGERGLRKRVTTWALDVGRAKVRRELAGSRPAVTLRAQHRLADRLVLSKLTRKVGLDRAPAPITGGAPITEDALEFMLAIGVRLCEGWAMSETSAAGLWNRPDAIRPGTVGTPMAGVEVRLGDDGELLYRSPGVMRGYHKDPERTAQTIDAQGWLHTGDIATIDDDGYVRIVDRKKELIINYAGKNMSPANIENAVKVACPLAGCVVAVGDRRPFVVALIVLDPDAVAAFAAEHRLTDITPEALSNDPTVNAAVAAGVEQANTALSRVEQVKAFAIMPSYWGPSGDELTPTMKPKRKVIAEKYAAEIDALYDSAAARKPVAQH